MYLAAHQCCTSVVYAKSKAPPDWTGGAAFAVGQPKAKAEAI